MKQPNCETFLQIKWQIMLLSCLLLWAVGCSSRQIPDQQKDTMLQVEELGENEYYYWVNSLRVPCQGVGPMQCLQVQKDELLAPDDWQLFYASIEHFEFEEGYLYQLIVKEEKLPPAQVPADASSIKYSLVKVVSKEIDPKLRLHDIWVLEEIEKEPIATDNIAERPRLEIHLAEMRVMGVDGCNNFNGSIKVVDSSKLAFGPIVSTRKMCLHMEIPDKFNAMMAQVHAYKLENLKLYLYDSLEHELLRFQKTD